MDHPLDLGAARPAPARHAGGGERLVASLLYEVSPADPVTVTAAVGILAAVALGACALPAVRALRTDPALTLRAE